MNTAQIIFVVTLIVTLLPIAACSAYLRISKVLSEKAREFLRFLILYSAMFGVLVSVIYIFKEGDISESWQLGLFPVLKVGFFTLLFFFVPTFLLFYFLYPFKFIDKRNFFKWILMAVAAIFLICIGVLIVALSFNNM